MEYFSSPKHTHWLWGPPSFLVSRYWTALLGSKCPQREVKHSHLVPRLRISGAILLLPPYTFMAWRGKTSLLHVLETVQHKNAGYAAKALPFEMASSMNP